MKLAAARSVCPNTAVKHSNHNTKDARRTAIVISLLQRRTLCPFSGSGVLLCRLYVVHLTKVTSHPVAK